jgi:2'-5' RNA ligase
MTASPTHLYFIALVPPSPILEEIREMKEYMAMHYQTKAALRSPAHITLHMPFQWRPDREEKLIENLASFASEKHGFLVNLKDFSAFKPRVIFIDVLPNSQLQLLHQDLERMMRKQLNLFNAAWKDHGFHPHMTIAFRDLRPARFDEAWKEFKNRNFEASFEAIDIVLLKHNQKQWEMYRRFPLKLSAEIG